jgi:hypothetical protein
VRKLQQAAIVTWGEPGQTPIQQGFGGDLGRRFPDTKQHPMGLPQPCHGSADKDNKQGYVSRQKQALSIF